MDYYGDYYAKDFSYINRDIATTTNHRKDGEKAHVINMWCRETMAGLKQFFYGGTLHGVKYIFEPTFSKKERATWILIVVISVCFCAVNITKLFSKWTSTPFVNVIDSLPTPIWAVPFPTVVLCPHLHVKMSYANVSKLGRLEEFFASLVCPRMLYMNKIREQRLNYLEIGELQKFILNGALSCSDIIKSCNWPASHETRWVTDDCCKKYFKPIFTDYGLCYAFNSLPMNGMKNDTLSWQRSFNAHASPAALQWDLDGGYPKVFPPDPTMKPFRVMVSGEDYGLSVELYLNISEHQHACDGNSLGFTVLIKSPTNHVYTTTVLRLPMDRLTTIEVSPITYKTDSALRSLAPNQRQCFFQNERQLEYYQFYTGCNCKHDLFVSESKRICNCTLYNWPRKSAMEPICSTAVDFECIDYVKGKVEEQQIYAYYAEWEEGKSSDEPTSCHPSCNDVIYDSQVFYSDLIKEPGDPSPVWGFPRKGELTQINVHFYEDMFLGQHRHGQYDDYYFAVYWTLNYFPKIVTMLGEEEFLGCPHGVEDLRSLNDKLNAKVIAQVNESQELVMINSFARETNEYQFKTCIQERISDIASWRWVFEDLSKRLEEAIGALHYEHNALRVVNERIESEIEDHSSDASRPGALNPMTDAVEKAILEENKFLREQQKNFEKIIEELDKQTKSLERTNKRIQNDILKKQQALSVENSCSNIDHGSVTRKSNDGKRKRKRFSSLTRWENRCVSLKRIGLQALSNAVITRQQVRGARVHLSIASQACAAKVDSALRRRLHANTSKLEEICWQREEAINDMKALDEELITAEKNVLETMKQERLVVARLADRTHRPPGELTKDDVDKRLKDELGRLRHFLSHLRSNIVRITTLQHHLGKSISHIDCFAEDISQVLRLDQDRMSLRLGDDSKCDQQISTQASATKKPSSHSARSDVTLTVIKEEDEEDYPFDN